MISRFAQRNAKNLMRRMAVVVVLASAVSTATAQTPGLQYTFVQGVDKLNTAGGINDVSGHGHNGTVIDSTFAEFVAGPSGNMNAIHIDSDNEPDETAGSGINTGTTVDNPDLNIFNGPYTVMAWCNLDDFGEHMVFGTPQPKAPGAGNDSAGSLHLGFRGTNVYQGWWGGGVLRDSNYRYVESASDQVTAQTGEWHHIAWRFTGASGPGYQDIFQDGVLYQRFRTPYYYGGILPENNSVMNAPTNLLIGRTVANNGAFSGSLSDVRVYSTALDDSVIAVIAASPP
jgi:hypothetical protein